MVILAIDFRSRVDKDNSVKPIFDTAKETISDLEKLDLAHSKRLAAVTESAINVIPVLFKQELA